MFQPNGTHGHTNPWHLPNEVRETKIQTVTQFVINNARLHFQPTELFWTFIVSSTSSCWWRCSDLLMCRNKLKFKMYFVKNFWWTIRKFSNVMIIFPLQKCSRFFRKFWKMFEKVILVSSENENVTKIPQYTSYCNIVLIRFVFWRTFRSITSHL